MNPANLKRAEEISMDIRGLDSDIEFLKKYRINTDCKNNIEFNYENKFYRLDLDDDDIDALIDSRERKRTNLLKQAERL